MTLYRVAPLPGDAIAASAMFHARDIPAIVAAPGAVLTIVFPPADHTHRGWRLAAVQSLARDRVPARVNAVAGDEETAIAAAERYLAGAPGVTGQLLPLDSHGAEAVLYPGA